uniref:Uncharacterized protein n=1 Tax=Arundo donax TaxID=35708 RepID=A0A0A8YUE8_ARUDO
MQNVLAVNKCYNFLASFHRVNSWIKLI